MHTHKKNERGVTALVVALILFPLICFAALGIDIAHLYVVRNELQNAADAGALAGARLLYCCAEDPGECDIDSGVNVQANERAYSTATANFSDNQPVEVNWSGGNSGDVQRGHWNPLDQTFTPNDSTALVDLWGVSAEDLYGNSDFINAVRVRTRREATPAESFFARVFGYDGFSLSAEAIAYRGFAGDLYRFDVDQPIAICRESILQPNGDYSCNIGRMINSGQNDLNNETGGWTNFNQNDACTGGANASVSELICGDGNPETLKFGVDMGTNGGQITSAFMDLVSCWRNESSDRTQPWQTTLPVVACPDNNMNVCQELRGAVTVNIIWITDQNANINNPDDVPYQMGDWSSNANTSERWNSFVQYFNLQNVDGSAALFDKKSIYFLPDCTKHEPRGGNGFDNYGIIACIPALVH